MGGDEVNEQVFLEAFYFLAIDDVSFQMLQRAPSEAQNGITLPSWCPDFQSKSSSMILEAGFSGRMFPVWQASKISQRITRGLDSEKLRLIDVRVSNVCFVSERWLHLNTHDKTQPADELQDKISHNAQWLKHCWDLVRRQYTEASDVEVDAIEAHFWRTTLAERTNPIGFEDLDLHDFHRLSAFLDRAVSHTSDCAQEVETARTEEGEAEKSTPASEMLILGMIDIEMRDKVLFLTKDGRFGLAYPGVRVGDTLCVLHGAKVPHLLRSRPANNSNTWAFVGEVYVHNLMQGEAEDLVDGRVLEAETFVLV